MLSLKTSIRRLVKARLHSSINVLGLSAGITVMLLAILYWRHEAGFDRFHANYRNIYRITTTFRENQDSEKSTAGATGQVQGPTFAKAIPEIRSYTRVMGGDIFSDLTFNDKTFKLRPLYVDPAFLTMFDFPLTRGNAQSALADKHLVVLTESTAKKFFGSTDVVGKTINTTGDPSFEKLGKPITISAIIKDPPENSSLQFDILFPFSYMQLSFTDEFWLNAYLGTFLELTPDADISELPKKFDQLYTAHAKEQLSESKRTYNFDPEVSYGLQNLADIHLNPMQRTQGNVENGVINGSRPIYSQVFLVLAGFILLMAAINFINLAVASSIHRSKEVGIRKISGGSVWQITLQLLLDSVVLCVISFVIAAVAVHLLLPLFNELTGKSLDISYIYHPHVFLWFVLLLCLLIATTGIYPAIALSRFKPVDVLYNAVLKRNNPWPARMLVVLQCTPAIILLIGAMVYHRQMDFVRTKDLGYNPDFIVRTAVYGDRDYKTALNFLKNELAKEPAIRKISFGNEGFNFPVNINSKRFQAIHKTIDENYLSLMQIPLLAGSDMHAANTAQDEALVNESFVRAAGLENPIGTTIQLDEYYEKKTKRIIGVVKDHHYRSTKVAITPMIFFSPREQDGEMWVKMDKQRLSQGIAALERAYKAALPGAIFQYNFLDELNAREFREEQRWQKVVTIGTFLAFIICSVGLFGLAHLAAYQRVREIGIRKVLGATVTQITVLLSSQFLALMAVSFIMAAPLAIIVMNYWLQNFAYRISIGPFMILFAAAISVSVTLMAVFFQSFRVALSSPLESLKRE